MRGRWRSLSSQSTEGTTDTFRPLGKWRRKLDTSEPVGSHLESRGRTDGHGRRVEVDLGEFSSMFDGVETLDGMSEGEGVMSGMLTGK